MIKLQTPLKKQDILKLKAGDEILLTGNIFTARDKAHEFLLKKDYSPISGSVIYHCGPLVKNDKVISAGPTTSGRMNKYMPKLIEKYDIAAVIGKGGMDDDVLQSLRGRAIYLSAIGGAGVLYADKIKVKDIYMEEFGMPEAIWEFEIKDFPLLVTMDSMGNSLYKQIEEKSRKNLKNLKK